MTTDSPSDAQFSGSRRLYGVLVADMTGFSRMMGEDESRAVGALVRIREVFASTVPRHGGTLDVLVGDCFVALFESSVDAVRAAIAIQTELAGATGPAGTPLLIRIGIHIGDVVRSGSEILGDSVNIAARLQTVARPGAIAVSEDVYRAVRNRISLPFRDLGARSFKNIRDKMRVFELHVAEAAGGGDRRPTASLRPVAVGVFGILLVAGLGVLGYRMVRQPRMQALFTGEEPPTPIATAGAPAEAIVSVGVTGVSAVGDVPQWMQDSTRDGLNTLLSKAGGLKVFSREKIDFLRQRRGLSEIEVAETLGIHKMISGSLQSDGDSVVIEVRVVDTSTGVLDASETVTGHAVDLIELQNDIARRVFEVLGLRLSDIEKNDLFARRTKETLDGYRRLAETFGEAPAAGSKPAARGDRTSWLGFASAAWADDASAEAAIRALIEAYRSALEREDVSAVAATHVELADEQRAGFERYFESAEQLRVSVTDVEVLVDGEAALVTFTRRDAFHDRKSGREVELEVRLSSEVVKKDDRWLLRGVKRSS